VNSREESNRGVCNSLFCWLLQPKTQLYNACHEPTQNGGGDLAKVEDLLACNADVNYDGVRVLFFIGEKLKSLLFRSRAIRAPACCTTCSQLLFFVNPLIFFVVSQTFQKCQSPSFVF